MNEDENAGRSTASQAAAGPHREPREPADSPAAPPAPGVVELVDCGDGRRLDRLGPFLLDRPAPASEGTGPLDPAAWRRADARFDRYGGWSGRRLPTAPWQVTVEDLTLELRATDTGQVGLFPEHITIWRWVVRRAEAQTGLRLLNLFAYTGGLSLAAARAGASVAHVDGSRSAVAWARRNAELSGLADAPIRWLVDDAAEFVAKEIRRGRRYDGVVLDPPSYGHGPRREPWRLEERLPDLLRSCAALLDEDRPFVLVTTHTPGWDASRLSTALAEAFPPERRRGGSIESGSLGTPAVSGAYLPGGAFARWRGKRR